MAQDDDLQVVPNPVPEDPDGADAEGAPAWLDHILRRPFLTSLALGLIAALCVGLFLPAQHTGAPKDVTAVVVASAVPDAPAVRPTPVIKTPDAKPAAEPKKPPLGEPPAPGVPIVAEVAVVIADTGLSRKVSEEIDRTMPRDATLAVSVYATDPAGTAGAFKTSGRDVWVQAAAQSLKGGIDPGPLAVSGSLSTKDNMALFDRQISAAGNNNVIGVYIPEDADITGADPDMWRDIAMNLIGANMMILDATPAKVATVLYMQKQESKISAYLKTDVIVSGDIGPAALQKSLAEALPIILNKQQAIIVLTKPTVPAVQTLSEWVKALPAKGIRLVPATKFTGLKG